MFNYLGKPSKNKKSESWDIVPTSAEPPPPPPIKLGTPYVFHGPNKVVGTHSTPLPSRLFGTYYPSSQTPCPPVGTMSQLSDFLFCYGFPLSSWLNMLFNLLINMIWLLLKVFVISKYFLAPLIGSYFLPGVAHQHLQIK